MWAFSYSVKTGVPFLPGSFAPLLPPSHEVNVGVRVISHYSWFSWALSLQPLPFSLPESLFRHPLKLLRFLSEVPSNQSTSDVCSCQTLLSQSICLLVCSEESRSISRSLTIFKPLGRNAFKLVNKTTHQGQNAKIGFYVPNYHLDVNCAPGDP